jgi:hypothetical protein
MAAIDLKKCTLKIQDGASTPHSTTVTVGEGNLTYTIARTIEYILDRGTMDKVREGDEVPCKVSFDLVYEFYTSDTAGGEPATPAEAIQGVGAASAWTTTGADACEPYAVDIIVEYNITCGTTLDETYTFSEFRFEQLDFDIKAGTISCSGSCNEIRPTSVRATIT